MCSERVEMRLVSSTDLVTVGVEYYCQCRQSFYSDKMKPVKPKSSKKAARQNG